MPPILTTLLVTTQSSWPECCRLAGKLISFSPQTEFLFFNSCNTAAMDPIHLSDPDILSCLGINTTSTDIELDMILTQDRDVHHHKVAALRDDKLQPHTTHTVG